MFNTIIIVLTFLMTSAYANTFTDSFTVYVDNASEFDSLQLRVVVICNNVESRGFRPGDPSSKDILVQCGTHEEEVPVIDGKAVIPEQAFLVGGQKRSYYQLQIIPIPVVHGRELPAYPFNVGIPVKKHIKDFHEIVRTYQWQNQ